MPTVLTFLKLKTCVQGQQVSRGASQRKVMKKLALLALYGVNRFKIELFGRANLIRVSTLFAPLQLLLPPRWGPHTSKRVQTHTLRFDLDDSIRPLISGSQCGCMQSGDEAMDSHGFKGPCDSRRDH